MAGPARGSGGALPAGDPRLSVVVPTDTFATIADLVRSLAAQSVASEIEVVVVCPESDGLAAVGEHGEFHSVQIVDVPLLPVGEARAAGVRAARAPVVAIAETHAFPTDTWADTILEAHDGPWAIVVPSIVNGNPSGVASWSALLLDYGLWVPGRVAGEVTDPPIYNASFKRDPLLGFGDRLGALLDPGSTLAAELYEDGGRAYYEPRARIEHLNLARWDAWLYERFLGGRLLAAARRSRWPFWRNAVYVAGTPLVPAVIIHRTRAIGRRANAASSPGWTRAAIVVACIAWAVGEAVGYAVGADAATEEQMLEYELHKARYL